MADVIKNLPEYSQMKERYSYHLDAVSDILEHLKKYGYTKQGEVEQMIISHTSKEGKKVK